jgi:hypothetical protein
MEPQLNLTYLMIIFLKKNIDIYKKKSIQRE